MVATLLLAGVFVPVFAEPPPLRIEAPMAPSGTMHMAAPVPPGPVPFLQPMSMPGPVRVTTCTGAFVTASGTGHLPAGACFYGRGSTGTYTDSSGTLRVAGVNQPRPTYDSTTHQYLGNLAEETRTNYIKNSTATGVVPGTPGSITSWGLLVYSDINYSVVGASRDNGMYCTDIRWHGTNSSGSAAFPGIDFHGNAPYVSSIPYLLSSIYYKVIKGAMINSVIQLYIKMELIK
jgi:hypothetical protein